MWIALAINVAMLVVEAVGGVLTGSLAVLADAGHLLSDVGSIGLALFAAAPRLAPGRRPPHLRLPALGGARRARQRPPPRRRRGRRSRSPRSAASATRPAIDGAGVLALGLLGLAGNVAATVVLAGGRREDLNLEGVLRHSFADALGSLGVVIAGAFVLAGGSSMVDPIVSLLIAALILASSWRLIKEPIEVLMEAAPEGIDVEAMGAAICSRGGRPLGPRPARLDA